MMYSDPKQIIQALSNSDQAWQQGNHLFLRQHTRWHYLTLFPDWRGIAAVSFVSDERAEDMVAHMLTKANVVRFSDIAPNFMAELAEKVLPDADAYRLLLANGRCHLIMGHTTDTLRPLVADTDTLVDTIEKLMDSGNRGSYLSFR